MTHQTAADKEHGDGPMLQMLGTLLAAGAAEMLEKDRGAVEDQERSTNQAERRYF